MKNLILACLLLCGCKNNGNQNVPDVSTISESKVELASFDWLLGKWKRVNDEGDKMTLEEWIKKTDSLYEGKGYTIENGENTWEENMSLIEKEGKWRLEVRMPSVEEPTVFKVTEIDQSSFVCENPQNEFPKLIKYYKDGSMLKAEILGDDMMIPFEFVPVD